VIFRWLSHFQQKATARHAGRSPSGDTDAAQAKAVIANGGTGVRNLVAVILRERCALVSTLEQA
jgi:hypothetical protein